MNSIEFARNLFLLRRAHKMTVEDLAAALEVTPEIVCEWECAKTSPTLDQMNRLAKVYGVPLSDVIRSPKPVDEEVFTPESGIAEEPEPEPEPETMSEPKTVPEESSETAEPPAGAARKKTPALWEILIVVLLLLIIAAALVFLIRPEWFPFRDLLGAWRIIQTALHR